jgi:uncharacterized protein
VEKLVGKGRFALLVVPDFHRAGRICDDPAFARKLRGWADDGCEIFLHGFTHLDESAHVTRAAHIKAQRMTAGEGEFLGLSYAEASRKLSEGRAMIEQAIGRPVAGFIAPAWLYGTDSLRAIADQGFDLVEDHFGVWNPQSGETFARGPVVTYASRSRLRLFSSLLWSRVASTLLSKAKTVRLAVHPHDVDAPELLTEIARALTAFAHSHTPSGYRELLSAEKTLPRYAESIALRRHHSETNKVQVIDGHAPYE